MLAELAGLRESIWRRIAVGVLIFLFTGWASAQESIRQVDFKNFTYPLSGPLLGHSNMRWLENPRAGYSRKKPIHLANGKDLSKGPVAGAEGEQQGFLFRSVQYAQLAGIEGEAAIVVLRYLTGGTQKTDYIYIYSFEGGKPKLRAYCFTGDRAYSGLYRVFGQGGELVVDLFDPDKRQGDCCSSGYVRTRYRWSGDRFVPDGRVKRGEVKQEEH